MILQFRNYENFAPPENGAKHIALSEDKLRRTPATHHSTLPYEMSTPDNNIWIQIGEIMTICTQVLRHFFVEHPLFEDTFTVLTLTCKMHIRIVFQKLACHARFEK